MLRKKKLIFLILIALFVIFTAGYVLSIVMRHTNSTKDFIDKHLNTATYHTLKPSDNPNVQLTPLKGDQAFAFDDQIDGTTITVSQQPLPADFEANPTQSVATLAQKYSATTKISAGDITAYTGQSTSGNQTTIFTKSGVLVFITSKKPITDDKLAVYIKSLN